MYVEIIPSSEQNPTGCSKRNNDADADVCKLKIQQKWCTFKRRVLVFMIESIMFLKLAIYGPYR